MPVKTLHGIGCLAFRQEECLMIVQFRAFRSPLWVIERSDLLKVGREDLLDLWVVSKVDRLHFTSEAPFVDDPGLTSNSRVSIATYREEDNLVQPGPGILEQCQHSLLTERKLRAIEHGI